MTQYGQILSKIATTLYKFAQYEEYFDNYLTSTISYLEHAKAPEVNFLYLPTKNNYYYYSISNNYLINEKTGNRYVIILTTKDKKTIVWEVGLAEFIINLIINNFSFENGNIMSASFTVNISLKTLFIALVGEDMYETLRANIK